MKEKTNSFVWVIILIGFIASSGAANRLYDWKVAVAPHETKVPTQFYAGMDKFLSNVSWMTMVQWQADDIHDTSPEHADKLFQKLNTLTNLDPWFVDAYLNGALSLAAARPDEAVQLLSKAMDMGLGRNWKVPFYAGQICLLNKKDPVAAVPYLEMAVKNPEAPDYIQSTLLHARCELAGEEPVASMQIWYEYYAALPAADASRRGTAIAQINEYAENANTALDGKLQSTTDPAAREALLQSRAKVAKIVKDLPPAPSPAPSPTTQPDV